MWQTLPEDVRQAILQAGEETAINIARGYTEGDEEAYAKLREMGKAVFELSPEVQAKMDERLTAVRDNWLQQMEQRSLPGDEILSKFQEYVAEEQEQ